STGMCSVPHCHCRVCSLLCIHDTAATELSPLSLHDALPICELVDERGVADAGGRLEQAREHGGAHRVIDDERRHGDVAAADGQRSEEHTSELQSRENLVCRLLLEKKK